MGRTGMSRLISVLLVLNFNCYVHSAQDLSVGVQCSRSADCGWNSHCDHGQCWCVHGYQKSQSGSGCLDVQCDVPGCVECADTSSCKRCEAFIDEASGSCLEKCDGEFSLVIGGAKLGMVCRASSPGLSTVYIAIIVAALLSTMLAVVVSLGIHCRLKTRREKSLKKKLMTEMLHGELGPGDTGGSDQFIGLDGVSYACIEEETRLRRLHYAHQVAVLRPHGDAFVLMLRDVKVNSRSLTGENWKTLMYRHLTHQLCRVLVVLNDRTTSMPPDGNLLLDWAQRLLRDYLTCQESGGRFTPDPLPRSSKHCHKHSRESCDKHSRESCTLPARLRPSQGCRGPTQSASVPRNHGAALYRATSVEGVRSEDRETCRSGSLLVVNEPIEV